MSVSSRYAGRVKFEDFDPNTPDEGQPVWAVYNDARFKTYATRGPALNAAMRHRRTKLYKYENGRWALLVVRDSQNKPDVCGHCGLTTVGHPERYDYQTRQYSADTSRTVNLGEWEWRRRGGKILDPPVLLFLCKTCAFGERNA